MKTPYNNRFSAGRLSGSLDVMNTTNRLLSLLHAQPTEAGAQSFFEANTSALTGSGYFLGDCLIRKFPLGTDFITDFAYVNPMSGRCLIWLIEIESPQKNIFTGGDAFTATFNQALQQVRDWMSWCWHNQQALRGQLEPLRQRSGDSIMNYIARGKLIYDRRHEISNQRRLERWESLIADNTMIEIRTYDGIAQEANDFLSHPIQGLDPVCVAYQNRQYVRI